MSDKHLSTQFDAELSGVSTRVLEMGGLVEAQVAAAVQALVQFSADQASAVLHTEERVNAMEVEIDRDTGQIEVVRYFMVNDFGTVINPMLVAGQAHGGVVQGIGQALMERTVYDQQGQPLTGSYMDYAMPRASDAPDFSIQNHSVPCKTNRLGIKGCGEAGCAGALPSVMNAVVDALSGLGVTHIDMPVTPEKVWRILNR